jgi:hypothetical protein
LQHFHPLVYSQDAPVGRSLFISFRAAAHLDLGAVATLVRRRRTTETRQFLRHAARVRSLYKLWITTCTCISDGSPVETCLFPRLLSPNWNHPSDMKHLRLFLVLLSVVVLHQSLTCLRYEIYCDLLPSCSKELIHPNLWSTHSK